MRRARGRSAAPSAGPIPTSPHRNLSSGLILCFVFLPSHVPHPVRHAPPVGTTLGGWVNPERRKGQNPSGVITLRLLRDRYRAPDPASGTSTRPRRRCGGSLLGVWHMVAGSQKASTGPRHRCRGSLANVRFPLVLERASTGPRHRCRGSPDRPQLHPPQPDASTGPRHRCRGSLELGGHLRAHLVASTGPRHRCRGSGVLDRLALRGACASTGPRHRCRGSLPVLLLRVFWL